MKKKLEADLISIAHRVLQIKNKSDINQLCIETRKLYEKLTILQFVEEHFEGVKPTIGQAEVVAKMKQFFEENHLSDLTPSKHIDEVIVKETEEEKIVSEEIVTNETNKVVEEETAEGDEEIAESPKEELNEIGFQPAFELDVEDKEEIEASKKMEAVQISFEDLLGADYSDTLFVKADQTEETPVSMDFDFVEKDDFQEDVLAESISESNASKSVSLNEKLSKGLNIDLNDRIAFIKHLFSNSDEDYNRVLNQLITYDSFDEAKNFIEDMVKPDYNSWEGKEDYEQRFIEIIEKKFA